MGQNKKELKCNAHEHCRRPGMGWGGTHRPWESHQETRGCPHLLLVLVKSQMPAVVHFSTIINSRKEQSKWKNGTANCISENSTDSFTQCLPVTYYVQVIITSKIKYATCVLRKWRHFIDLVTAIRRMNLKDTIFFHILFFSTCRRKGFLLLSHVTSF